MRQGQAPRPLQRYKTVLPRRTRRARRRRTKRLTPLLILVTLKFIRGPVFTPTSRKEMPPVLVLPYATLSFAFFAPLREAQAFPLARSLHSLKPQRYRDTKIAKEPWFSLSAYSAPSAVKASASQGEETSGIACATHSKRQGTAICYYKSLGKA